MLRRWGPRPPVRIKQVVHGIPLSNCCFSSCAEQITKTVSEKQLSRWGTTWFSSKTIQPAMRAQLHLPALDLSVLSRESSSTSLLLIYPVLSRESSSTSPLLISPVLSRESSSTSLLLIFPVLSRESSSTSLLLIYPVLSRESNSTSLLSISPVLSRESSSTSLLLISPVLSRESSSTSLLLISPGPWTVRQDNPLIQLRRAQLHLLSLDLSLAMQLSGLFVDHSHTAPELWVLITLSHGIYNANRFRFVILSVHSLL